MFNHQGYVIVSSWLSSEKDEDICMLILRYGVVMQSDSAILINWIIGEDHWGKGPSGPFAKQSLSLKSINNSIFIPE